MQKVIIDVREPSEYDISHVQGAINIPISAITGANPDLAAIHKSTDIVVYCRSGGRAGRAKNMLITLGYEYVTNGINQETIESNM